MCPIKTIIIARRGFVPSRFYPNLLVWDSVTQYEYTYRYLPSVFYLLNFLYILFIVITFAAWLKQ